MTTTTPTTLELTSFNPTAEREVQKKTKKRRKGLTLERAYTEAGKSPYEMIEWDRRSSVIRNPDGSVIFQMDDVEVPKTCDSLPKREDLREKLKEIDYLLVPGGTQLYIGTPHTYYSIYAEAPRPEMGESVAFLHGFDRLAIPLVDEDGARTRLGQGNGQIRSDGRFTHATLA